jgi:surfactin family lipopeptide synthetase A
MLRASFKENDVVTKGSVEALNLRYIETEDEALIERSNQELQESFDLAVPPLIRAALYNVRGEGHLFICMHHLICDKVSWNVLLDDLRYAYDEIASVGTVKLPGGSSTYAEYVSQLEAADFSKEVLYWEQVSREIPIEPFKNSGLQKHLQGTLEAQYSHALLSLRDESVLEVLLTALTKALSEWSGKEVNPISLEGHGRQLDIPLEQTIGWFTTVFPLVLEDKEDIASRLTFVKEALQKVPSGGLGYMILTEYKKVTRVVYPMVAFNYLGYESSGALSPYPSGEDVNPENRLENPITINVIILANGGININVSYDGAAVHRSEAELLISQFIYQLKTHIDFLEHRESERNLTHLSDLKMQELDEILRFYELN